MSPAIPRGSTGVKVYCQNQKKQDSTPCLGLGPSQSSASLASLTCGIELFGFCPLNLVIGQVYFCFWLSMADRVQTRGSSDWICVLILSYDH